MIFEHEIPSGSRLYFGQSATLKRQLENEASNYLLQQGYEEIVIPLFSHHQQRYFEQNQSLIRLNDSDNHEVTLRGDSTADVVRIVTKRLGRSYENRGWFYIHPVVKFPTSEEYQIGAEVIEGSFDGVLSDAAAILKRFGIAATLQLSNIKIPQLLCEEWGIDVEAIASMDIDAICHNQPDWVSKLVALATLSDLEDLSIYPEAIAVELEKLKSAACKVEGDNVVIAPLFYAKMRYYDSLVFRMFKNNALLATGGSYCIDEVEAAGFAIYSDAAISYKLQSER